MREERGERETKMQEMQDMIMEGREENKYDDRDEQKTSFSFGDRRNDYGSSQIDDDRNKSIEAIALQLQQNAKPKKNGFILYKHGRTYSNGRNSAVGTNGTCTPCSITALSRESSCNSLVGG